MFILLFLLWTGPAMGQSQEINKLKAQLEFADIDTQKVKILNDLAQGLIRRGMLRESRIYLNRAEKVSDSLNYITGREKVLLLYGELYLTANKPDSAARMLAKAINRYPDSEFTKRYYNLLATAHRYKGDNRRAIGIYQKILAETDTLNDARTAAGVAQNMADAYMNLGDGAEAFQHYSRSLAFAENAKDSLFLATALNNIGNAYEQQEKHDQASYYLERAISISKQIGSKPDLMRATLNLGNTRNNQGRFAEAESLYMEALRLSEEVRPGNPPIRILYNMGRMYGQMGELAEAEKTFKKSLQMSSEAGVPQGIYYNSNGLGNLAEERGELPEAIGWFNRALDVAKKLNNPSFLEESHRRLYELNKKGGNIENALGHLESFKTIADSLRTVEKEQLLAESQNQMELQRKDQINQILEAQSDEQQARLQFQSWLLIIGVVVIVVMIVFAALLYRSNRQKQEINRKLEEQKKELQRLNEVKNQLFAMISHDLRTPLSALTGMLELFRDESLSEEDLRGLAASLEMSLQQNVDIMENLLAWAKNQLAGFETHLQKLDAYDITQEIVEAHRFNAEHKGIDIENRISPQTTVMADYNLFKLVLRNLISNGIKFSGKGDKIVVYASQQNGNVNFEINDTGIGIPEEDQEQIFKSQNRSRKGTQEEKGSGMGLKLCKESIEKQGGTIRFESSEGVGTSFYFTLPSAN